jgi:type IX secretion system PorP/SprF family membrane protein
MKKAILSITLLVFGLTSIQAQQLPLYASYFFTPQITNPALSGSEGFSSLTTMHRQQWQGMEGAPETSALVFNGALNKERIGYSVYAFNDVTDIVSRSGIYGNYAYHAQLSENSVLSFGLGLGYLNNSFDMASVRVKNEGDPFLFPTNQNGTLDMNLGLNLQVSDFRIGLSVPQLLNPTINYSNNYSGPVAYHLIRHYVASTQYDLQIQKDRMVLSPMVTVRAAAFVAPQVDAGLMFNMKEYGYLGAMYRSNYAATLNAGVHLTPLLSVGYSHEFSTNAFASSLGLSNEFMLSYRFGDNKRNSRLESEVKRLKDKQRQASKETEKLLNERLEEFKDELGAAQKVELEKQTESLKKNLQEEGLKLQEAGNQRRSRKEKPSMNPSISDQDWNSNSNGALQSEGVIRGYRNENYANNVTPGSPGYYVTAGVYGESSNANRMASKLGNRGIQANVFRDVRNDMFYVYLMKFPSYQQADSAKSSGLRGQYSGKLWIKVVK